MATSKRPKTTNRPKATRGADQSSQIEGAEPEPLTGLSLAAFWSVPVTAVVAAVCAAWLGYLTFVNPPEKAASNSLALSPAESADEVSQTSGESARKRLSSTTSPEIAKAGSESKKAGVSAEVAPSPGGLPFPDRSVASSRRASSFKKSVPDTLDSNNQAFASSPKSEMAEKQSKSADPSGSGQRSEKEMETVLSTNAKSSDSTDAGSMAGTDSADAGGEKVALEAKPVYSLRIADGEIVLAGQGELAFDSKRPSIENTKGSSSSFPHLLFDGSEQAIELPPIQKTQGSIIVTVKVPEFKTSIFFDSSYQRLTLRKNAGGIRWRIEGGTRQNKIRNVAKDFDPAKWHHVVMTWHADKEAVLFVDGVEFDRYPYVNEQPQFPSYEKVIIGKTRGPNGNHYECKIGELTVYDAPISADNVAKLHTSLREKYPFIFSE